MTVLSVKQVAERLQISEDSVYSLVASGKLASLRIGPRSATIRVTEDALTEYLNGCRSSDDQPRVKRKRTYHFQELFRK